MKILLNFIFNYVIIVVIVYFLVKDRQKPKNSKMVKILSAKAGEHGGMKTIFTENFTLYRTRGTSVSAELCPSC